MPLLSEEGDGDGNLDGDGDDCGGAGSTKDGERLSTSNPICRAV